MTPEQNFAVVTALLTAEPDPAAFPVIRAGGADPRYPVTIEACPTHAVPPTEVEGSTLICGRVNVPEDHDKPAFNAALKFLFLAGDTGVQAQMFDICESFTPAPRKGYHEPVTSSIPALVLYGLNDTQTSSADAKDTAAKLGNARVPGFPEAGHGVLMFSRCDKDIGLAFIEQPEAELATACIEGLKPMWVLPPG